jgi:hypothetical protein
MTDEPIYMRRHSLADNERRLLTALWALGFIVWIGAGACWLFTASLLPWFALSVAGGAAAVVFGMAVRYRLRFFPWWWK